MDGEINIISYDLASKVIENQQQFGFVIVDESHFIKNRTAKRTQAVGRITCAARRVIMLSGTPALSRPEELYNQVSFLQPLLFPTFHSYAYRYCAAFRVRIIFSFVSRANHFTGKVGVGFFRQFTFRRVTFATERNYDDSQAER